MGGNQVKFNMCDQSFPLQRELEPLIILDRNFKHGPDAALYSMILPGLGNYFVKDSKEMIFKPYMKTISVAALFILANIANNKRENYISYTKDIWVEERYVKYVGYVPAHYETQEFRNENPNNYWLFNNDKEIFLGAAISIWVFDIFWTLNKGSLNRNIKNALGERKCSIGASNKAISFKMYLN